MPESNAEAASTWGSHSVAPPCLALTCLPAWLLSMHVFVCCSVPRQLCATTIVLLTCALTGVFRPTKRGTTPLCGHVGSMHHGC